VASGPPSDSWPRDGDGISLGSGWENVLVAYVGFCLLRSLDSAVHSVLDRLFVEEFTLYVAKTIVVGESV
jgi:hypothetical protein